MHVENLNLTDKIASIEYNVSILEKTLSLRDNEFAKKLLIWDEKFKAAEKNQV